MFAKLAQFQARGSSRAASAPRRLVHSNDNRSCARPCGPPARIRRRILVCRWQPATGRGGLECRWSMELVEATPADEPQRRWTIAPSGHPIDSPKEVDNVHHSRVQVRPPPRAPLGSSILRCSINLYERRMIPPIVLRVALSAVRFLERSAALLVFGHRPHGDQKDLGRSHRP